MADLATHSDPKRRALSFSTPSARLSVNSARNLSYILVTGKQELRCRRSNTTSFLISQAIVDRRRHAGTDADLVAKLLVKAELRGYAGHGVTRVSQYLRFIENKTYDLSAVPAIEHEGKVTAVVDGKHYVGQVAATMAMQIAISKAKEHGAGIVCLRRAGHTGRLADYMEMATDEGLIGMGAVSVGSATTTLYGGMNAITGTNPMAFGIPARMENLSFSTSRQLP